MPTATNGDLQIAYQLDGPADGRPLLLAQGALGRQSVSWPAPVVAQLARRGYQVLRMDYRDTGASTRIPSPPEPDLAAALVGDYSTAAYRIADLATDAAAVLDAVGWSSAHILAPPWEASSRRN